MKHSDHGPDFLAERQVSSPWIVGESRIWFMIGLADSWRCGSRHDCTAYRVVGQPARHGTSDRPVTSATATRLQTLGTTDCEPLVTISDPWTCQDASDRPWTCES